MALEFNARDSSAFFQTPPPLTAELKLSFQTIKEVFYAPFTPGPRKSFHNFSQQQQQQKVKNSEFLTGNKDFIHPSSYCKTCLHSLVSANIFLIFAQLANNSEARC
jgi:hypothetical protein